MADLDARLTNLAERTPLPGDMMHDLAETLAVERLRRFVESPWSRHQPFPRGKQWCPFGGRSANRDPHSSREPILWAPLPLEAYGALAHMALRY